MTVVLTQAKYEASVKLAPAVMSGISKEVLVKLIADLLKCLIVPVAVAAYKAWWPKLVDRLAAIPVGRRRRLKHLNELIDTYSNFTHAEEMEARSRIYRYVLNAVRWCALGLFLTTPVILIFILGFTEVVGLDVIQHLRPDMPLPHQIPFSSAKAPGSRYIGVVLGIPFGIAFIYLGEAQVAAQSLSVKYREKMLTRWRQARSELEVKLGLPLSTRSNS